MNPRPSSSIASAVCAGVSATCAPSASSTSALPEEEDTERPMCFATFAPAAAAISPIVSFLTRRPMMKPAICACESSPRMIWRMMCSISS